MTGAVSDWSPTPGSNGTLAGLSCAEGSTKISSFNNFIREILAAVRAYANGAEWFLYGDGDASASFPYVSATSFKVTGADVTTSYHAGRRVKATGSTTGTIYGTISSSSFSTDTSVVVAWDSGSLSNETLTVYLAVNSVINTSLPLSSTTVKGIIEAATTTEQLTGTDATRAATPDSIAALWEKGSDIASAGTISIGEGGYFHVTGTTTITDIDFGTDKAGRAVWLIFDGALTLTHNATTLILPGGANITTAAGDACLVVSEDGSDNVRVPIYSRKSGAATVVAAQTVIQQVRAEDGAVATGSTQLPWDDTIPQNTEGDQYLSVSITPTSATSKLVIEVFANFASGSGPSVISGALFQDSTAGALAATATALPSANVSIPIVLTHTMTSGTTSSITFKFRAGPSSAATITFNGASAARKFGGVSASMIIVTEYSA